MSLKIWKQWKKRTSKWVSTIFCPRVSNTERWTRFFNVRYRKSIIDFLFLLTMLLLAMVSSACAYFVDRLGPTWTCIRNRAMRDIAEERKEEVELELVLTWKGSRMWIYCWIYFKLFYVRLVDLGTYVALIISGTFSFIYGAPPSLHRPLATYIGNHCPKARTARKFFNKEFGQNCNHRDIRAEWVERITAIQTGVSDAFDTVLFYHMHDEQRAGLQLCVEARESTQFF